MNDIFEKNWFMAIRNEPSAAINVICFPWGGGGSAAFLPWRLLKANVNIWAVKLPGRESRLHSMLITSAVQLVREIVSALPATLDLPYVFYGHSMGAGIAMQTIMALEQQSRRLPSMLIASGRMPAHYKSDNPIADMDDNALIAFLNSSITIPVHDKNFLQLYLPKIRADYELNSSIPVICPRKLPLKISVINGQEDTLVNFEKLLEWSQYSHHALLYDVMPGGHFFMQENLMGFLNLIAKNLTVIL